MIYNELFFYLLKPLLRNFKIDNFDVIRIELKYGSA